MTDDTYRAELRDRLAKIAAAEGLKPKDVEAVTDAAIAAGVSLWFHGVEEDARIADKLHILASKRSELFASRDVAEPALNGPGPRLPPAFVATLGSLDWSKLPAAQRLQLWDRWCEKNNHPARTLNANTPRTAAPQPGNPLTRSAQTAEQRLAAHYASGELVQLEADLASLRRASSPTSPMATHSRQQKIQRVSDRIASIRRRAS
ncbi:MAG: hypothetical protein WA864_00575 [Acetobacteraceae bacterium]